MNHIQKARWMVAVFAFVLGSSIFAASPVGVWKTIDDETGKAKSHVEIFDRNGKLYGKIIKLINPSEPNPLCTKCKGSKKDKPVIGMEIIWDMEKDGANHYEDGHIMDPNNGKTYGCELTLVNSNTLKVRGFIGFSLLGRNQTWYRVK